MNRFFAVFGNDAVTHQLIRIPASGLSKAIERQLHFSVAHGLPSGTPMHIAHDLHRVAGWTETIGLYLDGNVVQQVGFLHVPTTDEEAAAIRVVQTMYIDLRHKEFCAPFEEGLRQRAAPAAGAEARIAFCTSAVLAEEGLAARLYPRLFEDKSPSVDKDGLVSYRDLLTEVAEIQPGIFLDKNRGLLLFAHQDFRRSLSRLNNLNAYFLRALSVLVKDRPDLDIRLRLDPDLVGHPDSLFHAIELEYWHGPPFDSDISMIPAGVTVHAARDRERSIEGIDSMHFWWKGAEERAGPDGSTVAYRTFEAEELIDNPSFGLSDDAYGCRYVHAEFSEAKGTITHFDGAIRCYRGEAYLQRLDAQIDRAGKQSEYTKLFRVDGSLEVSSWKSLLTNFFRGNNLVPEYLNGELTTAASSDKTEAAPSTHTGDATAGVRALVSYSRIENETSSSGLALDRLLAWGGQEVRYLERYDGEGFNLVTRGVDLRRVFQAQFSDGIVNFPRITIPRNAETDVLKGRLLDIANAIEIDVSNKRLEATSLAFTWLWEDLSITLSLAGAAETVSTFLRKLAGIVDIKRAPSDWIEELKKIVVQMASSADSAVDPHELVDHGGFLTLPHRTTDESGGVSFNLLVPRVLLEDGKNDTTKQ